ncbi:hypothetical protein QF03_004446 [Salmonella enterica subsp. enterica]|nr:hypothetical protein [Salmonella enterica subsp. enterica]
MNDNTVKNSIIKMGVFTIIGAVNLLLALKWLVPVLFKNIDNGYYDSFSFISMLCGNNPDNTILHFLNVSQYDTFLSIFLWPGIVVSWLAFFAIYKLTFWMVPLYAFGYSIKEKAA